METIGFQLEKHLSYFHDSDMCILREKWEAVKLFARGSIDLPIQAMHHYNQLKDKHKTLLLSIALSVSKASSVITLNIIICVLWL